MFDVTDIEYNQWEEQRAGSAAARSVIKSIELKILPRVTQEVCFSTTFSALDTLSKIANVITHTESC